jgi:two-component system, NtrC family, nitrogen regulation response regulator NtrX
VDDTDTGAGVIISMGTILHVDDEQGVRESLALLLKGEGYEVASAAHGPAAMGLVGEGCQPDILIVDFNLEDEMNGADVAQQIRTGLGYSPPVIMLTGRPADAELPWVTDAPVWLAGKPLDPRLLLAALPGLIDVSRCMRAVRDRRTSGMRKAAT